MVPGISAFEVDCRTNATIVPGAHGEAVLFTGVALLNTATVGLTTAGSLIIAAGSGPGWSGLPNVASVLGAAAAGALVAFAGALTTSVVPMLLGILVVGVGNGGAQLSRYVAADMYPDERRGRALANVVWAGTIGALAGPALMAPAANVAEGLGWPSLSGPFAVAVFATVGAALAATLLPRGVPERLPERPAVPGAGGPVRSGTVLRPLAAMVAAQLAMVAVMTMTPVQLRAHGHGLDVVSWVLGAHLFGMFALAPLSGRIADRWGPRVTINAGLGVLALAAPTAYTTGLPAALFLLGYGWNLVFVGGSAQLSRDLAPETRSRVRGVADAVVWSASALAGLGSGQLFSGGGYASVAVVGGVLALLPLVLLAPRRS